MRASFGLGKVFILSSVSFGLAFFLLLHPDFFYVIVIVWCSSLDALSVPVAAWDTGDQQFYICFVYDDHRRNQDARIDDKRLKHSYLLKKGEEKSIQALNGHMKCNDPKFLIQNMQKAREVLKWIKDGDEEEIDDLDHEDKSHGGGKSHGEVTEQKKMRCPEVIQWRVDDDLMVAEDCSVGGESERSVVYGASPRSLMDTGPDYHLARLFLKDVQRQDALRWPLAPSADLRTITIFVRIGETFDMTANDLLLKLQQSSGTLRD